MNEGASGVDNPPFLVKIEQTSRFLRGEGVQGAATEDVGFGVHVGSVRNLEAGAAVKVNGRGAVAGSGGRKGVEVGGEDGARGLL